MLARGHGGGQPITWVHHATSVNDMAMKPGPELDARLRTWLEACDPKAPLDSKDDRYVDLGTEHLRGERDPKLELLDTIALAPDRATCQLFSGFQGTGKSTELARLHSYLEDAGFTVLMADAEESLTLTRKLSIEELLPAIAGSFGSAAGELLGKKDVLDAGWWQRFHGFMRSHVSLTPALKIGPVELKAALRGDEAFLDQLREALAGRVDPLSEQVHQFVAGLVREINERWPGTLGVVFILDSLEKLSGPEHRFAEWMESALGVFADQNRHLRLPGCHTIYTVPLYLEHLRPNLSEHFDGTIEVLPNVTITERDPGRTPRRDGLEAMKSVLEGRLSIDGLFASDAQLERVLLASGGHLRGMFDLVSDLLRRSRRRGIPSEDAHVTECVDRFLERRRQGVRVEGARLLEGILNSFELDRVDDADLPRLARYLESSLVLCYRNGDGWYDLHPGIRGHVARLAALARELEMGDRRG